MIKLYSTGCPKCRVLEKKLAEKSIEYNLISDKDIMKEKGLSFLPVLEIDDRLLEFKDAVNWVNEEK